MNSILRQLDYVFTYLDDITIANFNTDEHISNLTHLFEWLKDFSIIFHPEKCVHGTSQVEILENAQSTFPHPLFAAIFRDVQFLPSGH